MLARDIPIRRKQAERGVLIIQAGLSQAEWEIAYAVARTYLSAVYARAQQRVAEEDVNATQKNRDVIKDLAIGGRINNAGTVSFCADLRDGTQAIFTGSGQELTRITDTGPDSPSLHSTKTSPASGTPPSGTRAGSRG